MSSLPNPKTPKTPAYVGIGTLVHRTMMVDGRRRPWQPPPPWRNPPAQNHGCHGNSWSDPAIPLTRTEPLDKVLDESGLLGFGEKLLIHSGVDNLLHITMPNRQIMPPARNGGRDGHRRWLWRLLLYRPFINVIINNSITQFELKLTIY